MLAQRPGGVNKYVCAIHTGSGKKTVRKKVKDKEK